MLKLFKTQRPAPPRADAIEDTIKGGPAEVTVESLAPERIETGALVVGAFADGTLPEPIASRIDARSKGRLAAVIAARDLGKRAGSTVMLRDLPRIAAKRVLLVSLGDRTEFGDRAFRDAIDSAARALAAGGARDAAVTLADVEVPNRSLAWRLQMATRLLVDHGYRFTLPDASPNSPNSSKSDDAARGGPRRITLLVSSKITPALRAAVRHGQAIAEGMALAKDLGNLPGNICTPPYLANMARELGSTFNFTVEILEREHMRTLGMGAALAVGQASAQPCKFIVMHYKGPGAPVRPIVLVGKGVTFDTGGISLKPGANMDQMKFDMCGAGSVFGVMNTVGRLALPLNLVGLIPAVENMPGGNATRPGDIVKSMSGQTIEILNTDAEGRLALADALTYAERYDPACVIDIATLTGACVIALGHVTSGLLANDDALAEELLESGTASGDRAWRLPLFDEYQDQLKSSYADMSNLGGSPAGAITAGCFLARFAKRFKWAHLDIAGTNVQTGESAKGATGRPVPLLSEFLINRANAPA